MQYSEINRNSITALMDIFYNKVRKDENLSRIFNEKIGTDENSWDNHKEKVANFWLANLLGEEGVYRGYPLKAHLELDPFPREFFSIWLGLFESSLHEVYDNEDSIKKVLQRANLIAERFQKLLYEVPHP